MAQKAIRYLQWVCGTGLLLGSGCEAKFVGDAARQSLASFLNSVFSSAVNNVIIS